MSSEATMGAFQPRQILVGTDFSELSASALRHAAMWSAQYGAQLTVLHAQEFPAIGTDPYFGSFSLAGLIEASREATEQQIVEHVRQNVPEGVSVSWELTPGSPASAIEEKARATSADLVVLGTHGRGGLTRLLLGSVAERALRLADHPTLVVRQTGREGGSEGARARGGESATEPDSRHDLATRGAPIAPSPPRALAQVLCPVNYTDVARIAFELAAAVAETFGARLTVVSIVEPRDQGATDAGTAHGSPAQGTKDRLRAWLPAAAINGCEIQVLVRHGDAAEQVITLARETDVDLVVVGAQHRLFIDSTVLGVTTVRVTRHAPCPVLIVPRSE